MFLFFVFFWLFFLQIVGAGKKMDLNFKTPM